VHAPRISLLNPRRARRKENIIGQRGGAPKLGGVQNYSSIAATPMQSDDSGQIVMRKVPARRRRPEWQDVNHTDYKGGGSAQRPLYMERRRPHRISVRTPESARDALIKELDRAEGIAARAKKSPKKVDRQAADELTSEIKSLRKSLGSGRKGVKDPAVEAPEDAGDLMASIDALSSVLDNKLALIAEASSEQLAGTASSFVNGMSVGKAITHDDSKPAEPVDECQTSQPPAPLPSEDDPVVRSDVNGWEEEEDMCLHSDSVDEADEALAREQTENRDGGVRGECEEEEALEGGEDGEYDDDFETSLLAGDGDGEGAPEEGVSEEVVEKLNETSRKLDALEALLAPGDAAENRPQEPQRRADAGGANCALPEGGGNTEQALRTSDGRTPGQEARDAAAAAHEAPALRAEEAVACAAPVSRIASKPFSFKSKLGAAAPASGGAAKKVNLMSFFASGPTILNGEQRKAQEAKEIPSNALHALAGTAAKPDGVVARAEATGAAAPGAECGRPGLPSQAHGPVGQACISAHADAVSAESLPDAAARGAAGAHAAPATSGGGRAGRGLLNLGGSPSSDIRPADAAPAYVPSNAPGARAGRGLLDMNGHGGGERGSHAPDVGATGAAGAAGAGGVSRATTASSSGSEIADGRREWPGASSGNERERAPSAGGKKKISKEEIRRAMIAAQPGTPAEAALPPAANPVCGRRRTADDDAPREPVPVGMVGGAPGFAPPGFAPLVEFPCGPGVLEPDGNAGYGAGVCRGEEGRGVVSSDRHDDANLSCQDLVSLPGPARQGVGAGRRGPVRATGPPRFAAGIGAEAKAALDADPFDAANRRAEPAVPKMMAGAALDSSLDRSLDCEEL